MRTIMLKKIMFSVVFAGIVVTLSVGIVLATESSIDAVVAVRREPVVISGTVQSVQYDFATVELQDDTLIVLRELPDFILESGLQIFVLGERLDDGRIIANSLSRDDAFDIVPPSQLPPVVIDLTGQVEIYDTHSGAITINGATGILLNMPEDPVQTDVYLTVSGELMPNGRLLIDSLAPFEPEPFVPLDATGISAVCHIPPGDLSEPYAIMIDTDAVPVHLAHGDYPGACDGEETSVSCDGMCDPILLILADSFSVPYAELAVLEAQGFGAGTIAQLYILAEITGAHTDELAESLLAGVTWQEILQSQPRTEYDVLASHSIIGNGRGESVRVSQ